MPALPARQDGIVWPYPRINFLTLRVTPSDKDQTSPLTKTLAVPPVPPPRQAGSPTPQVSPRGRAQPGNGRRSAEQAVSAGVRTLAPCSTRRPSPGHTWARDGRGVMRKACRETSAPVMILDFRRRFYKRKTLGLLTSFRRACVAAVLQCCEREFLFTETLVVEILTDPINRYQVLLCTKQCGAERKVR